MSEVPAGSFLSPAVLPRKFVYRCRSKGEARNSSLSWFATSQSLSELPGVAATPLTPSPALLSLVLGHLQLVGHFEVVWVGGSWPGCEPCFWLLPRLLGNPADLISSLRGVFCSAEMGTSLQGGAVGENQGAAV